MSSHLDSLARAGPQGNVSTPDIGKMQIVLELSNQISEQTDQITKLNKELKEKESIIKRLGGTKKLEEEYSKDKEDMKNLRKLSQGLNHYRNSESEALRDSDEETRGVSGASRDSGLGSAGKTEDRQTGKRGATILTDSDWESDDLPEELGPHTIKSAPPETQALRAASRLASRESNDSRLPFRLTPGENDSRLSSRLASRESINSRLPSRLASRESQLSSKTLVETDEDHISIDDMTAYKGSHRMRKKSSFTSRIRRENETSLRTPIPSVAFEEEAKDINEIPMYPSTTSKRYPKKKKSSFFLTQTGNSPAGSDISEQISVG